MNDLEDTKSKLFAVLTSQSKPNSVATDIFSDASFKKAMDSILHNQKEI